MRTATNPKQIVTLAISCASLIVLLACCASQKTGEGNPGRELVWPPSPAQPRIRYVRSVAGPVDIGQNRSAWMKFSGWLSGNSDKADALLKPFGLALDEDENLCITDTGAAAVYFCDFSHKHWSRFDAVGLDHFVAPVGVAKRNGTFYVADSELGKVLAFQNADHLVFEIGAPLKRPTGLTLSGDKLFVTDAIEHKVFAFDLRGRLQFQFGTRGSSPGAFNFPTHIASDRNGTLYVTDSMNARIQIFDATGQFLRAIGSSGDTSGHFGHPKGAAIDSTGNLYVVDGLFDNVQVFDSSGHLLLNWGEAGSDPGQFWLPNGIVLSPANRLFIADTYNRRVQLFDLIEAP